MGQGLERVPKMPTERKKGKAKLQRIRRHAVTFACQRTL